MKRLYPMLLLAGLSACTAGPNYVRPATVVPAAYKEAGNWVTAVPADEQPRGPWWQVFGDPVLDRLAAQIHVSNQTLAASEAAYRQARALVREQRAGYFPTIELDASGQRARSRSAGSGSGTAGVGQNFLADISASWEPDLWGSVRRAVEAADASAAASAADLAGVRLSIQGALAANYLQLRETDVEIALVAATIRAYQRALEITRNRYAMKIDARSDVLQAQTQLANARAAELALQQQRALLEHAIAVLVGKAPADFSLGEDPHWSAQVPQIPLELPSTLLQRRPDIAGAERRMAAANAQIGVNEAAFFPAITLTGSRGVGASQVRHLFDAESSLWSLGVALAQVVFDGGARRARVDAAKAAYDQAVAVYRQTTLAAFQNVEDQLAATRLLEQQAARLMEASRAADEAERISLNQYQAGLIAYTDVVVTQTVALSARQAVAKVQGARQTTAVALIQALGGGVGPFHGSDLTPP
ncbi:efflux transporter outer membrane subunit [Stenotrophomonas sp. YIM B06876]|uniref:efflux transporter outer membrane subunit n=1 Tax=Stenotrophomonas sp. YIM B06876 TaxID=3060211 RepID=UPI0027381C9C|nr:efflux transporter outer membrane subunit [Stenotrophomonas sp. YIM B06876]